MGKSLTQQNRNRKFSETPAAGPETFSSVRTVLQPIGLHLLVRSALMARLWLFTVTDPLQSVGRLKHKGVSHRGVTTFLRVERPRPAIYTEGPFTQKGQVQLIRAICFKDEHKGWRQGCSLFSSARCLGLDAEAFVLKVHSAVTVSLPPCCCHFVMSARALALFVGQNC